MFMDLTCFQLRNIQQEIRKNRPIHAGQPKLRLILKRYLHFCVADGDLPFDVLAVLNAVERVQHRLWIHGVCVIFQAVEKLLIHDSIYIAGSP